MAMEVGANGGGSLDSDVIEDGSSNFLNFCKDESCTSRDGSPTENTSPLTIVS